MIEPCPYQIDVIYSDNGNEYKGTTQHEFAKVCYDNHINQKFTKVGRPQTNGKAERVIRTLMEIDVVKQLNDRAPIINDIDELINFYRTDKVILKRQPDFKNWQGDKLHKEILDDLFKKDNIEFQLKYQKACFVAGTLVHTDKGLVPIQDIKVGDMVLSRDQHNPEGELVYKPVVRTIVTENVPVFYMNMTPESVDELPFHEQNNFNLYVDILCTANHPIWINNKGWIKAGEVEMNDTSVLKTGELVFCEVGSSGEILEPVFFTKEPNVGFIPNFSNQTNNGKFVNLLTGKALYHGGYDPVFRKLFVEDTHWRKRLLEQTPAEYQDNAEFYGFRTGFWQDGAGIDWAEGEGPVTTTVYNIEVADTHTYFVGEHGVWVHDVNVILKLKNDSPLWTYKE